MHRREDVSQKLNEMKPHNKRASTLHEGTYKLHFESNILCFKFQFQKYLRFDRLNLCSHSEISNCTVIIE